MEARFKHTQREIQWHNAQASSPNPITKQSVKIYWQTEPPACISKDIFQQTSTKTYMTKLRIANPVRMLPQISTGKQNNNTHDHAHAHII